MRRDARRASRMTGARVAKWECLCGLTSSPTGNEATKVTLELTEGYALVIFHKLPRFDAQHLGNLEYVVFVRRHLPRRPPIGGVLGYSYTFCQILVGKETTV